MYVGVTHYYSLCFYCIYDTIEIVSFTEKPIFGSVKIINVSYCNVFLSTGAVMSIVLSGIAWLMYSGLTMFISPVYSFILTLVLGVVWIIVPVVNHIGIFIAIRRHNRRVVEAVSGNNLSVIFRREKKAAIDMIIVIAVLLLCLAPSIPVNIFLVSSADKSGVLRLWCASLVYVNSSINPVIYCVWKSDIRRAVKSILSFWLLNCSH